MRSEILTPMLKFDKESGEQPFIVFVTEGESAVLDKQKRGRGTRQRKGGACISTEFARSNMLSPSCYHTVCCVTVSFYRLNSVWEVQNGVRTVASSLPLGYWLRLPSRPASLSPGQIGTRWFYCFSLWASTRHKWLHLGTWIVPFKYLSIWSLS